MRTTIKTLLAGSVLAITAAAFSGAAQADYRICNKTSDPVDLAYAYNDADNEWRAEGWFYIDPYDCETVIQGALSNKYYYFYAESSTGEWSGDYAFCVNDQAFTLVGDHDYCGNEEGFFEVDVGNATNWTTNLTE